MIVLGIIDSKPSSAAILRDGQIISAIAEERLCRMKMASGMPRQAIKQVMVEAGITAQDIDMVAVAQRISVFEPDPIPWNGWFDKNYAGKPRPFEKISGVLAPVAGYIPFAQKAHHQLKDLFSRKRLSQIPEYLEKEYGITAPVKYYDHHYCHAASTYYTSNYDRALIITLDGGGDGLSGSVYQGGNGRLTRLSAVDSFNSLGNFYSYITHLCGFKAESHEGKITGLAALGKPTYINILREFVSYAEPGQIQYAVPMYHRSALKQIASRLPGNFDKADLAASVQLLLEEIGIQFIQYWLQKTGIRSIAVAGGVFSNVKFNQRIHELPEVDKFFVHPAMDDSGLAVGGAFAALVDQSGMDPKTLCQRLKNVYFGTSYSDDEIRRSIDVFGFEATYESNITDVIAKLLSEGRVVACFTGKMEYGPRALGHRSILYQTTDPSINDWLNAHLLRTEFMPFAPATLQEYADECFEGLDGARDSARFMTITFNCTEKMRAQSPGVVHVDGTARPQILDPDTAPDFYKVGVAYHKLTGIPSLINTSFNMHGEPIVCTPEDALRSFNEGKLDYLAIGNWLVVNPELKKNGKS
ncbi:MAG TPA: carbamoyltransferase C-terminal domain-containing protein [Anaerolineales bacterium]|nr:carbamoyltransferase C-terminal domain-containing protein [Anaerolineales bacterium]